MQLAVEAMPAARTCSRRFDLGARPARPHAPPVKMTEGALVLAMAALSLVISGPRTQVFHPSGTLQL